jgi:hypothetical protein
MVSMRAPPALLACAMRRLASVKTNGAAIVSCARCESCGDDALGLKKLYSAAFASFLGERRKGCGSFEAKSGDRIKAGRAAGGIEAE